MSCIEIGEEPTNLQEGLPDVQLFAMCVMENQFVDIIHFLTTGMAPEEYTSQQKKDLVVGMTDFVPLQGIYIKWACHKE